MECLTKLVGLSQNDCECFDEGKPATAGDSLSGFFVDDEEFGVPLVFPEGAAGCGDDGVWSILEKALSDGINEFITAFGAGMEHGYLHKRARWKGLFGKPKDNAALYNSTDPLLGFMYDPCPIRGATLIIKSAGLYLASANNPAKEIKIYEEDNPVPLKTIQINAIAEKRVETDLDNPLHLPLTNSNGEAIRYHFVYERDGDDPMDVKFKCGCSGENRGWEKYGELRGFDKTDISGFFNLGENYQGSSYSNGLVIGAELQCGSVDWLCLLSDTTSLGPYMQTVAKVIQLYAINKVLAKTLNSSNPNRFVATVPRQEKLYGKRNHNRKLIDERMQWLIEKAQYQGVNDCIKCKSAEYQMTRTIKA